MKIELLETISQNNIKEMIRARIEKWIVEVEKEKGIY